MMPDLPNVGWERDIESFREFFENPAFRSDGLKLYPTQVIRGTGLYELWKAGLYRNYAPSFLVDLVRRAQRRSMPAASCGRPCMPGRGARERRRARQVARVVALVPPWVRIYRIQRDIPMPLVTSGVEKGNLRELALARMGQLGLRCRDVRTREAGIQARCPARARAARPGRPPPRLLCPEARRAARRPRRPARAGRTCTAASRRRRSSSCGGTTPPMAGGRRSSRTRTRGRTSWSASCACAGCRAAPQTGSRSSGAAARSCASCMCTAPPWPCTRVTPPNTSTRRAMRARAGSTGWLVMHVR